MNENGTINMGMGNTITTTSGMSNITTTTTTATINLYTHPQMLDVIVNPTTIEIVYKRQLMMSNGFGMPEPEVYKVIYSRNDGSEKTIFGTYIPSSDESYSF